MYSFHGFLCSDLFKIQLCTQVRTQGTITFKGCRRVGVIENHAEKMERYTHMTASQSWKGLPCHGLLFKLKSGERTIDKLREYAPDNMFIQCSPSGSFAEAEILEFLAD